MDLGSLISLFLIRIEGWLFLCSFSFARLAELFDTHYCVKPQRLLGVDQRLLILKLDDDIDSIADSSAELDTRSYSSRLYPRFPDIY